MDIEKLLDKLSNKKGFSFNKSSKEYVALCEKIKKLYEFLSTIGDTESDKIKASVISRRTKFDKISFLVHGTFLAFYTHERFFEAMKDICEFDITWIDSSCVELEFVIDYSDAVLI